MTDGQPALDQAVQPFASRERFDVALDRVKRLSASGLLGWRIGGPSGLLAPRFPDGALEHEFGGSEQEQEEFSSILTEEIVPMLNMASGRRGFPMVDPTRHEDWTEAQRGEHRERRRIVRDQLFVGSLRDRFAIRRSCKGPVLEDVRWDVSVKHYDSVTDGVGLVPFATVEFVYTPNAADLDSVSSFFGSNRSTIAFDCHIDDLDAIIRDLSEVRERLVGLQSVEPTDAKRTTT